MEWVFGIFVVLIIVIIIIGIAVVSAINKESQTPNRHQLTNRLRSIEDYQAKDNIKLVMDFEGYHTGTKGTVVSRSISQYGDKFVNIELEDGHRFALSWRTIEAIEKI